MSTSTAVAMTRRAAMMEASRRGREVGTPERYYWHAVWWRLHSRESADPATAREYSRNFLRLRADMTRQPERYVRRLAWDTRTDWQIFTGTPEPK